jgi:hypothetical protein
MSREAGMERCAASGFAAPLIGFLFLPCRVSLGHSSLTMPQSESSRDGVGQGKGPSNTTSAVL